MNTACSTCLESFSSKSDVSATPCGHVFHTQCIEKWISSGQNKCSQCRREFGHSQITKLYFSDGGAEIDLISELEEEKSVAIGQSMILEEENLLLREENTKLRRENLSFREENTNLIRQNLNLRQEYFGLSNHCTSFISNATTVERNLKRENKELREKAKNAEHEVNLLKSKLEDIEKQKAFDTIESTSRRLKKDKIQKYFESKLHAASILGNLEDFKTIMEMVENVNPQDHAGRTPLHHAASNGHTRIVKEILNVVEDKNPKTGISRRTPLHLAAFRGHEEIVRMILEVVDDKNPKDAYGRTPSFFARSKDYSNICEMIHNVTSI